MHLVFDLLIQWNVLRTYVDFNVAVVCYDASLYLNLSELDGNPEFSERLERKWMASGCDCANESLVGHALPAARSLGANWKTTAMDNA